MALDHGVLDVNTAFFDYGCGRGEDVRQLAADGVQAKGWDPYFQPDSPTEPADVVNLGYVINAIEDTAEREQAIKSAFDLARQCLVVSAQLENAQNGGCEFGDGVLTSRNTFQKYYTQFELREYVESVVGQEAIAAAPGIFYVFKCAAAQQDFLAQRTRRRYQPRARRGATLEERIQPHEALLREFVEKVEEIGRLPARGEFEQADELRKKIGSAQYCADVAEQYFDDFSLTQARQKVHADLRVYLALANFSRVPKRNELNPSLLRSVEEVFGGYKHAVQVARGLLYSTGDPERVSAACAEANVGKLLPDDLYIHVSEKNNLDPILRTYIGCAEACTGEVPDANIIKIHRHSKKISFLIYKDFDRNPHPPLLFSLRVDFVKRQLREQDFSTRENPPILHRKELLVGQDYPHYEKFAKLTRAEERAGLYENTRGLGTRNGWEAVLTTKGWRLDGHRLRRLSV